MKVKLIKDPIHGYIKLDNKFTPLINTGAFQRLKRLGKEIYKPSGKITQVPDEWKISVTK